MSEMTGYRAQLSKLSVFICIAIVSQLEQKQTQKWSNSWTMESQAPLCRDEEGEMQRGQNTCLGSHGSLMWVLGHPEGTSFLFQDRDSLNPQKDLQMG